LSAIGRDTTSISKPHVRHAGAFTLRHSPAQSNQFFTTMHIDSVQVLPPPCPSPFAKEGPKQHVAPSGPLQRLVIPVNEAVERTQFGSTGSLASLCPNNDPLRVRVFKGFGVQ